MLAQILNLAQGQQLFDLADFVGVTRPGVDLDPPFIGELPSTGMTPRSALAISTGAGRGVLSTSRSCNWADGCRSPNAA